MLCHKMNKNCVRWHNNNINNNIFETYIEYHDLFDGAKLLALLAKVISDVIQDSGILLVINKIIITRTL